ncbi:MAG: response regulator [Burkholderiaceae bacterium]
MTDDAPDILLVEDSPTDIELFMFAHTQVNKSATTVRVVRDGVEALEFLLGDQTCPGDVLDEPPGGSRVASPAVGREGASLWPLGGASPQGGPGETHIALPRLVLLDLNMPRMNGFEVLERLRADPRTRLLPVVILSASDEKSDAIEAQRLGASDYVRKPGRFEDLCATLAELERRWLGARTE